MRESARTAIRRSRLSAPARLLSERGAIVGRALDYGCGHGFDCTALGIAGWDPFHRPTPEPSGQYQTILCTYVLNTLDEVESAVVVDRIRALLAPGGCAYLTVRRDVHRYGFTASGTFQRPVTLNLDVYAERKGAFCIYVVTGE